MKTLLLIILLTILVSCDGKRHDEIVLSDYRCTREQLALVDKEVKICNTTLYYSSHCFASAKESICTKLHRDFDDNKTIGE